MAGKDKLTKHMRAYVGGYDLSGDARTFSSLENAFSEVDMTGWSNGMRYYLAEGFRQSGVRGFQAFVNDASGGGFDVMKDIDNDLDVIIAFGGGGAPALGDPAYMVGGIQLMGNVQLDGSTPVISGDFVPSAGEYGDGMRNPMGVLLYPKTQINSTTSASSIDNGASSAAGLLAVLQVFEASGTTWTIKVQHSANDADWSDLITFSADGSAITSEVGLATGTVNQYLRAQFTPAAGNTGTFAMAVARGYAINQQV